MPISQEIREAMEARGVSQAEVCARTGMSPSLLARMLRDDDHNYTVKTLRRLASAIGVDLEIAFVWGPDPDPPGTVRTTVGSMTGGPVYSSTVIRGEDEGPEEFILLPRGGREMKVTMEVAEDFNIDEFMKLVSGEESE